MLRTYALLMALTILWAQPYVLHAKNDAAAAEADSLISLGEADVSEERFVDAIQHFMVAQKIAERNKLADLLYLATYDMDEELPDSLNPIVLDEDFALMSDGNYPTSHYEELSSSLDAHTHTPGWNGSQVYSAGGYVRVGGYGANGWISTPHLNFAADADSCVVAFHAVSYPGKSVNYTVSLTDNENVTIESQNLKATKEEEEVRLVFHGVVDGCRLRFTTQKERLFLNDLRVLTDSLQGIWNAGPQSWAIEGIADTEWTFCNLAPGRTYHCKVMAEGTNNMAGSSYSDELSFTTPLTLGISAVTALSAREAWYDLQGRRVAHPSHGMYIHHFTGSDGRPYTEKVIVR